MCIVWVSVPSNRLKYILFSFELLIFHKSKNGMFYYVVNDLNFDLWWSDNVVVIIIKIV
jgi:hypothetical protein